MIGFKQKLRPVWRSLLAAGNHDFCPNLNRYFYWLKQPIGWFVIAAVASLLVAIMLGPQGWVLFAGIVSVTLLGVLWPALAMRGLCAELSFDRRRVTEQQVVRVKLRVSNRWPLPIWGLSLDRGFSSDCDRAGRPVIALGCVRPWSTAEFEWEHTPGTRGVLPVAQPILSNGFPFGIWQAERVVQVPVKLLVWPRTFTLDGIPEISGNRFAVTGMLQPKSGHDGEFIGIRPYRQGDSLRHIHWAQTARQDELIVCERQTHCRRSVRIELDPAMIAGESAASWETSREWLFRVSASLCKAFHSHRFQIACQLGDELIELPESALDIKPILDRMAMWKSPAAEMEASGSLASTYAAADQVEKADRDSNAGSGSGKSKLGASSLRLLVATPEQFAVRMAQSGSLTDERIVLVQNGSARNAEPVEENGLVGLHRSGARQRVLLSVSVDQLAQHVSPHWISLGENTHAA
jgi:hypothetical protein